MRTRILCAVFVGLLLVAVPVQGYSATLYVDARGGCGGNKPCYTHIQDAVNAAGPFDTILVYPGRYGSRHYTSPAPAHRAGPADEWAPALMVYKNGLTIRAVDLDPALTIIETKHPWWSNSVAVQASTGGTWDGRRYKGAGLSPSCRTAPHAVIIVANDVTIDGFTIRRPFDRRTGDVECIMIDGLYTDSEVTSTRTVFSGNTIRNCVIGYSDFSQRITAGIAIWHSYNNVIINNSIYDPRKAGINIYDDEARDVTSASTDKAGNIAVGNIIVGDVHTANPVTAIFIGTRDTASRDNLSRGSEVRESDAAENRDVTLRTSRSADIRTVPCRGNAEWAPIGVSDDERAFDETFRTIWKDVTVSVAGTKRREF
jgi:hypothetical protein